MKLRLTTCLVFLAGYATVALAYPTLAPEAHSGSSGLGFPAISLPGGVLDICPTLNTVDTCTPGFTNGSAHWKPCPLGNCKAFIGSASLDRTGDAYYAYANHDGNAECAVATGLRPAASDEPSGRRHRGNGLWGFSHMKTVAVAAGKGD
jgi:hypothetical protein